MRLLQLFAIAGFLVGCRSHIKRTVEQFSFVDVGMPLSLVTNRVGAPDRGYRGQIRLRYDLADGSEMVIVSEGGESFEKWRVWWFGQSRDGEWIWVKPPEILKR